MGMCTATSLRLLNDAARRSGRRSTVQLPGRFARKAEAHDTSTPLSEMFMAGEAVMKVYLTLLLLTCKEPHDLNKKVGDHYWASLFGYEELDPQRPSTGPGTKRIKRAMAKLAATGPTSETRWIIRGPRVPRQGYPITVTHMGTEGPPYITVPLEFWSNGWIAVISARGLFVYLILRLVLAGKPDSTGIHVSKDQRAQHFIGYDTWARGLKELERLGLARTQLAQSVEDDWHSELAFRKVVYLRTTFLKENLSPKYPIDLKAPAPTANPENPEEFAAPAAT